jgi:hypothetical protein
MRRPPDIADARAAWWAWRAIRDARVQLRDGAIRDVRLDAPPAVGRGAARAVRLVIAKQRPSCLERSLVMQRWLAAHGIERDVVVGTDGRPGVNFAAHAWLDGEAETPGARYAEILRLAP